MFKQVNTRLIGGILLLTGTAIGGGLLALPIATAETGFLNSLVLIVGCWLLMTVSALLVLEVNLWLPVNTNLISMTRVLLNPWGTLIAWMSYLLLLYSIVAAYIAGGAEFLHNLFQTYLPLYTFSHAFYAVLFTLVLGSIVQRGIHWVDYSNRILMVVKLGAYFLLVGTLSPLISPRKLLDGETQFIAKGFAVMVTSFSYANIIPSLRAYFKDDIASLRKAILIGSSIPLVCYIIWNGTVMGIVSLEGENGLIHLLHAPHPTSGLINQLTHQLNSKALMILFHSFTFVCVLTTFLSCSLGLSDFLADGLNLNYRKNYKSNFIIFISTFLPPLIVALFSPNFFIKALNYAGIYCLILFILLPVAMAWRGRYYTANKLSNKHQVPGGKPMLVSLAFSALLGIVYSLYQLY